MAALMAAMAAGPAGAQVTLGAGNLQVPDYYDKLTDIVNAQIAGHRVVAEYKLWEPTRPDDPNPVTVGRKVAIHGRDQWVLRDSFPPPGGDGRDRYVRVVTPDAFYFIALKPASGKFVVNEHGTEWQKPDGYARTVGYFPAAIQLYQPKDVAAVSEVADGEYEGRRTKRITLRTRGGVTHITHVDRKTYQHLYSESDRVYSPKTRGDAPGKSVRRTEYREEGGRLWPTRQESYQVGEDGVRQPVAETIILEYAPYAPSADELDLEAQFGVKPIPHEPRPDSARPNPLRSAGGTGAWLYAAAGVLAAAAVAVVVVRRRRRPTVAA